MEIACVILPVKKDAVLCNHYILNDLFHTVRFVVVFVLSFFFFFEDRR